MIAPAAVWIGLALAGSNPPDRLAVVPVLLSMSPRVDRSAVILAVGEAADAHPGLSVLSSAEVFARGHEDLVDRIRDCGTDVGCVSSHLRDLGARRGLIVLINARVDPPLVSSSLIDASEGREIGARTLRVQGGSDGILAAVRAGAEALFVEAGYARAGRLLITLEPPDASLQITPRTERPVSRSEWASGFDVAPGRYEIEAAKDGFVTSARIVEVEAGRSSALHLVLERDGAIVDSPWLWLGVAAAVAAAVTTGVAVATSGQDCFCIASSQRACPPCR